MSAESMTYVGFNPCGCIGMLVIDDPEHPKYTAKSVAKAIRDGLTLERKPTEWVRSPECSLRPCADNPDCVRRPKPRAKRATAQEALL